MADDVNKPTSLTLVYEGLLSKIQSLCSAQMRNVNTDDDRKVIVAIREIAASRLTEALKQSNQLAEMAHDLDEQRAATLALGQMLMIIKSDLEAPIVDTDVEVAFDREKTLKQIDDLLKRDMVSDVLVEHDEMRDRISHLEALVNSPEIIQFVQGAVHEAAHQRDRWGPRHDEVKTMGDWTNVFVHLLGKFVKAGWDRDLDKTLHHLITVAAVAANAHSWLVKMKKQPPPSTPGQAPG